MDRMYRYNPKTSYKPNNGTYLQFIYIYIYIYI